MPCTRRWLLILAGLASAALLTACFGGTPTLVWRFPGKGYAGSLPALADGTIYYQSFSGVVYALDGATGTTRWEFATGGGGGSAPLVVDEDLLVVGSGSKNVIGLDRSTGTQRWACPTKGPLMANGVVHEGIYYSTTWGGALVAVNVASGEPTLFGAGKVEGLFNESTPAVGAQALFVSGYYGTPFLLALELASGDERWRAPIARDKDVSPVFADDVVYFGDRKGQVKAVDAVLGSELWAAPVPGDVQYPPIVQGDRLFVPVIDGAVVALDLKTGRKLWQHDVGAAVGGGLASDGSIVVFGTTDALIHAVSASNGSPQWKFKTGSGVESTGLIHKDILYMGSTDNCLYALKLP